MLPVSAWRDGDLETVAAEGAVDRTAWQIQSADLTTMQLLAPLSAQLLDAGFDVLFECEARACGGFDFRYAMHVLPEPAMHVDLGDYRYAAFRHPGDVEDYVSLLVSRSANRGFVQITQVAPTGSAETATATPGETSKADTPLRVPPAAPTTGGVVAALRSRGHTVLSDLTFGSGASTLGEGPFASLEALAAWLRENPDTRIALVGHTDATGALAGNIALSKKRAQAVRERLVTAYGLDGGKISAEGVGYLAPLANNATDAGRRSNRRVEAVLLEGG
ncbi:OmpA family protein [Tropicimonas isoalkanivorans]|nr:OmpA family protein [Tropicimonas isoalkanivorans]